MTVHLPVGNLGLDANRSANRETIALMPIFDGKRHPKVKEKDWPAVKKKLFLLCLQVQL